MGTDALEMALGSAEPKEALKALIIETLTATRKEDSHNDRFETLEKELKEIKELLKESLAAR